MSRTRAAAVVLTTLVAGLLAAQLLVLGQADSPLGVTQLAGGPAQGVSHDQPGWDDAAGQLRHRTRQSVGNQLDPEYLLPTGLSTAYTIVATFAAARDRYRAAMRYSVAVPSRDTSPAALQILRC